MLCLAAGGGDSPEPLSWCGEFETARAGIKKYRPRVCEDIVSINERVRTLYVHRKRIGAVFRKSRHQAQRSGVVILTSTTSWLTDLSDLTAKLVGAPGPSAKVIDREKK